MPQSANISKQWFALRVRPGKEKSVAQMLRDKDYTVFLPIYNLRRTWADRVTYSEKPLFSGYLICCMFLDSRLDVLTVPGVIEIVGHGRSPAPISNAEIDALQLIVRSGLPSEPHAYIAQGQRVRIDRGPLRGLEGIISRLKSQSRLVVSVELLQRSVAVEVSDTNLVSVEPSTRPLTVTAAPL